jgi:hypothetical protein
MKAYELLSDSSKWTKGAGARDNDGIRCSPASPDAVCWCLFGAITRCYDNPFQIAAMVEKLISETYNEGYYKAESFNDAPDTTYNDIISLLKEADV